MTEWICPEGQGGEVVASRSGEVESGGTVGSGPVSDLRVHQDLMSILARNFATE